jgi:hypothetical protein
MKLLIAVACASCLALSAATPSASGHARPDLTTTAAAHHHWSARRHSPARRVAGVIGVKVADGQIIQVSARYADRFEKFFAALYRREGHLPEIGCFAPRGHMRHSLHHWGGACDVGQTDRNVAPRMMYHVTKLAARFGLTDGCTWRRPDCGHIDVSGLLHQTRFASRHTRHRYAAR